MLELFPQEKKLRIEKEGSLQLFVSALLDLAEDSLREDQEEQAKLESKLIAGKKENIKTKPPAVPTALRCSSLENHLIEKNI